MIEFPQETSVESVARVAEALESLGCLVLRVAGGGGEGRGTFGSEPTIRPIGAGELAHRLLPHEVRHHVSEEPGAARYMRLARTFSSASAWELTPGGTVGETADNLHRALRHAPVTSS
jgi:hypothetical protein